MLHITKATSRSFLAAAVKMLAVVVLGVTANQAMASRFDANVGSDSARIGFAITTLEARQGSDLELNASYLGSEINDENVNIFALGAHIVGDAGTGFLKTEVGVGSQFFFTDVDEVDGGALSIGGFFIGRFAAYDRVGFSAQVYYAPDLLTFSDVDQYVEYSIAAEYDVLRETTLYLNYRQVKVDFEFDDFDDQVTVDNGVNIGLRVLF